MLVENKSGYNIKATRSDRGGELTSKEFEEYYENYEIHWLLMVPYSPQWNEVIEKKNRTILDMAQSLLKNKKMPKEFWVEGVDCAIHSSNYSLNWSA